MKGELMKASLKSECQAVAHTLVMTSTMLAVVGAAIDDYVAHAEAERTMDLPDVERGTG